MKQAFRRLMARRQKTGGIRLPYFAIGFLVVLSLCALAAEWVAPFDPGQTSLRARFLPPAWADGGSIEHLLGTDDLGRDVLSRIIHGARLSLTVAAIAVFASGTLGVTLGVVAGYFGGLVDAVIMRISDAASAIPLVLLALLFVITLGQSFWNLVIALTVLLWSRYTRVVRSEVLSLKNRDYIALARISGCSNTRILLRYVLPNAANSILVMLTLQVGVVIILEAVLSFLGAGVPSSAGAWGTMVNEGRGFVSTHWWIPFFPGLAILLTVLSVNLIGDWVRDRLDPRMATP